MSEEIRVEAIADGVWRMAGLSRGGILTVNCYLVREAASFIAIDAGPANQADAILAAMASVARPAEVGQLVLLDDGPFAASGLAAWRNAGFKGEIVADWRAALGIAAAGIAGPYRYVHKERDGFSCDGPSILELRILSGHPGQLFAMHCRTGCLFSGMVGSSMGRGLPTVSEAPGRAMRAFVAAFGSTGPALDEVVAAFDPLPAMVCPRSGSCMRSDSIPDPGVWTSAPVTSADGDAASKEVVSLLEEIDQLRTDNLDLRSSMVFASDAALRDEISGLYGRSYADEFLRSLIKQGSLFSGIFIEVDRLKELNREAGVEGGDRVIADAAGFLSERFTGGFLFRWSGPVFLLVLESDRKEAFVQAESMRASLEADRRFSRPVTVSAAIVGNDELRGDAPEARLSSLQSFARARLKLLERRGGNEVLADSGSDVREKTMALVLDGDSISADYLVEFLNRREFSAIGAGRGGEALELMERYQPEVVIADAYLPQFDAFQIRARMLASPDLRRVPFVLLAQAKTDELVERAHTLRIFHVFEKPVPLVELLGVVRYLIGHGSDVD